MEKLLKRIEPLTRFVEKYAESWYALIVYSVIAMIGWGFMLTELVLPIFGVIALLLAISCKRFNAILGVFGLALFAIYTSTEIMGIVLGAGSIIGFILIALSFVLFMYKNKVKPNFNANFYGICALSIVMAGGGIFNYKSGFLPSLMIIGISLAFPIAYLLLASTLSREGKRFYMQTTMVMGLIICLQTFVLILRSPDANSMLVDKTIWYGWGISNTAAIMLVVSCCASIYLVTTCKKLPALYMLAAFMQAGVMALLFARASLLIFAICFIPLSIFVIAKSENRRQVVVSYCTMLAVGIVSLALVLKFVVPDLVSSLIQRGFDGRGREELFAEAIEVFRNNIPFGAGFLYKPQSMELTTPVMQFFHNTYLQFLASGGVCGLIAVFMHKMAQYRPFLHRDLFKGDNFVIGAFLIMVASNMFGLMDITIWAQNYFIPVLPLMAIMDDVQKHKFPAAVATKNKKLRSVDEVAIKTMAIILGGGSFGVMMLTANLMGVEYVLKLMDSITAIIIMVFLYILREAFRAVGYLTLLDVPRSSLRFGRSRKSKFLYSHNTAPMYSRDMLLVELYPMLMTAVAPAVCATVVGSVYMMAAVAVMFACSASDILLAYSLGKRSGMVVQDHPTMPAYYINYPDIEPEVEDSEPSTDTAKSTEADN